LSRKKKQGTSSTLAIPIPYCCSPTHSLSDFLSCLSGLRTGSHSHCDTEFMSRRSFLGKTRCPRVEFGVKERLHSEVRNAEVGVLLCIPQGGQGHRYRTVILRKTDGLRKGAIAMFFLGTDCGLLEAQLQPPFCSFPILVFPVRVAGRSHLP
jgi:hypothetical protein